MFSQIILIWNYKKQVLYAEEILTSHGFILVWKDGKAVIPCLFLETKFQLSYEKIKI